MTHTLTLALLFVGIFASPALANSISAKKAMAITKSENAIIIDVREKSELSSGLAEPARWVPYSSFRKKNGEWAKFQKEISNKKNIPIVVYCAVGGRASQVVSYLKNIGHKAYNMGGFRDWKSSGLPVKQK